MLKPPVGSGGRLISRVDSGIAAEASIEHQDVLGSYTHATTGVNIAGKIVNYLVAVARGDIAK